MLPRTDPVIIDPDIVIPETPILFYEPLRVEECRKKKQFFKKASGMV